MDEKAIKKTLFPVFVTTQMVVRRAKHVKIASYDSILKCADVLLSRWQKFSRGLSDAVDPAVSLHKLDASYEEHARWLFVVDTVNFSFWPDHGKPRWSVEYGGRKWSGYWALAASLKRAYEEGLPITNAAFLAELSRDTLENIFRGKGEIPLFEARLSNLREAGRILLTNFNGDVMELIEAAEKSAEKLVELVVLNFPSFRDEALYEGSRVFFWKRAQLYAFDLYTTFNGKGPGEFHDLDVLTAFADYKLPQVLRALGVIRYSEELSSKIDRRVLIEPGSDEEVEIRSATVQAVELLRQAIEELTRPREPIPAARIDQFLWYLGQEDAFRIMPYHLCRTIFY